MNEQEQKKQIELTVSINQQEHIYRHDTMEAAQVPEFLEETDRRLQEQKQRRQRLWDDSLRGQPQQIIARAETQPQPPVAAPAQETYKQSRQRKKEEKQAIKLGKKYTRNANIYTYELMRIKELNDPLNTGPEGIAPDIGQEELTEAVKRMTETKISADMFSEENFPEKSVILRRCLYEFRSIEGLMKANPEFFQGLEQNDPLRYKKLLHCQNLAAPIEDMLVCASLSCGVTDVGNPVMAVETAEMARRHRDLQLREFSRLLANENAIYEGEFQSYLKERMEQELPDYMAKTQDFQRRYLEDNPQSAWMDIPALNSELQFEAIEKAKNLLEENGERYLANKDMCDAMFSDLTRSIETYAILKAQSSAYDELKYRLDTAESTKQDSAALSRLATKKIDELMEESYKAMDRYEAIMATLKAFLRDNKLMAINVAVLSEYGYDAEPQYREKALQSASATAVRSRWQKETLTRLLADERVHVGSHESEYVQRAASMFRQNDDDYNIALLNHFERVRALGDANPSKELYDSTRQLLMPYVQKVLNWDMAAALRMDNEELADNQEQLDALFCDNMFVTDILNMKHWSGKPYTMKGELLGDRIYDFASRLNTLRGLYEKSRAIAIKRAAKIQVLPPNTFTEKEWTSKIGNQNKILDFAEERLSIGNRLMDIEKKKALEYGDINSEAFKERTHKHILETARIGNLYQQGKFHAIEQEFWDAMNKLKEGKEELSEEERVVGETMARLHDEGYRLAAFDNEEAKRLGVHENIGEMLFRSFGRYTESEGGRTMTEDQFRRMLLDLGAGYKMKHGETPEAEISQARERNMRGCREYKETMRLQYGLLARKYGYAVENLSIKYIADHYMELTRDFANLQTDTNLMSNIPGLFDMENPEDVMLKHQAEYYNLMGYAILNGLNPFIASGMTEAEIIAETRRQAQLGNVGVSRAYLIAHQNDHSFAGVLNPNAVMDQRRQIN